MPLIAFGGVNYGSLILSFNKDILYSFGNILGYSNDFNVDLPNGNYSIKDSVPNFLVLTKPVINPNLPLYDLHDSIAVGWSSLYTIDSLDVFIQYSGSYHFAKRSYSFAQQDSIFITLDSTSTLASIKIISYPSNDSAFSDLFSIVGSKYLKLDTVYFSNSTDINFIVTSKGITKITAYYSVDTLNWQRITDFTISNIKMRVNPTRLIPYN